MEEAFQNQAAWNQCQEWTVLRPPLGLQVTEAHGHARRLFGLHLAAVVPDRSAGTRDKVDKTDQDYIVDQNTDQVHSEEEVRFHGVPRKGWDRYFRGMRCQARNVINWKGWLGIVLKEILCDCTLSPARSRSFATASPAWMLAVAQQQSLLRSLGWRVVSAPVEVVQDLGNKVRLQDFAQARGLTQHLPKRYMSAECADYPCILKQAHGEFGKDCYRCDVCLNFGTIHPDLLTVALPLLVLLVPLLPEECNIVHSPEDVCKVTPQGLGTRWVLQERDCSVDF
eukprot:g23964.t2